MIFKLLDIISLADACVQMDTPGKIARMSIFLAIRHHVKTEARVIRSVNMTMSASVPKVSNAPTFFILSHREISPHYVLPFL